MDYLISILVNFPCELGQIMTRYDFLWAKRMILVIFDLISLVPMYWGGGGVNNDLI